MERAYLIRHLDQLSNVERKTKELFVSVFSVHVLQDKQEFKCPITPHRFIFFNIDGLLHLFQKTLIDEQSKLTSLAFYVRGQLFTLYQNHSPHTKVVALRPSRFLVADFKKITSIIQQDQAILDLLEDIDKQCQYDHHQRIALLTAPTATARYQIANTNLGLELYYIPKHILANHLNMSRKQLQRIAYKQLLLERHSPMEKNNNHGTTTNTFSSLS